MRAIFITVLVVLLGMASTAIAEKLERMLTLETITMYSDQEKTQTAKSLMKGRIVFANDIEKSDWIAVYEKFNSDKPIGYAEAAMFIPHFHTKGKKIPHVKAREKNLIIAFQQLLNARGCKVGKVDGVIGKKTRIGLSRLSTNFRIFDPAFSPAYYTHLRNHRNHICSGKLHDDLKRGLTDKCKRIYSKAWRKSHSAFYRYRNGCSAGVSHPSKRSAIRGGKRACKKISNGDECWLVFTK